MKYNVLTSLLEIAMARLEKSKTKQEAEQGNVPFQARGEMYGKETKSIQNFVALNI